MGNYSIIEESHKRSKAFNVDCEKRFCEKICDKEDLEKLLQENEEFIKVASTYIEMVYDALNDKNFLITLTDKDGYIIYAKAHDESMKRFKSVNLVIGACMSEKYVGTNSMGTAIEENSCVQITGEDHYLKIFKKLTCSAAPIHDRNGEIMGTLCLSGEWDKKHPHTKGLVLFGVKAIENELFKVRASELLSYVYNDEKDVIEKKQIINGNTGAIFTFENIIGESRGLKNVIEDCKAISNSPSTILIEGESGTGKEVLAQSIHNFSSRKDNMFIAINCGALPLNIIESELFGYEDGTFTGGKRGGKIGKIEAANGGTLFLDEIGEMPLDIQVKLLRVLQENRITRLGSSKEIKVDIRVIAATNKNLKEEIKKGNFREDLYYRLCVLPVYLPALRERQGDIEILIDYYLKVKSFKLGKEVPKIKKPLYNKLINYTWPGNIRQLENYMENIVNLGGKLSFDIEENEINYKENIINKKIIEDKSDEEENFNLQKVEEKIIIEAIKYNKGNLSKTAKDLGISRNTLYLKIKRYNIEL